MNTISLFFKSLASHRLGRVYTITVFFMAMLLFLIPSSTVLAANCSASEEEIVITYDTDYDQYYAYIPSSTIYPSGTEFTLPYPAGLIDLYVVVRDYLDDLGAIETDNKDPVYISGYWDDGYLCYSIPSPTLNIMVDDFNIDEYIEGPFTMGYGDSTYINWSGSYISNCSINQGIGSVSTSGYKYVSPTEDTTYTVTCDADTGGTISDSVTININTPPTVDIEANNSDSAITITKGTSFELSWTTEDADYWSITENITGSSLGVLPSSGVVSGITPIQTTTYTIVASNSYGNADPDSVTVNVQPAVATVSLSSNVGSILSGNSATLTYSGTNIVSGSCAISPTVGSVTGTSGTRTVYPTTTTTYTLTCTGDSTTDGETVSTSVSVIVYPRVTASISASPTTINPGGSTSVSWSSTNAESCVGTNFTTYNSQSGSTSKSPTTTTTYSVTCTNSFDASDTATDSVTVTVETLTPSISLTPSSQGIIKGSSANLTYSGSNIVSGSCTINQGYGSVSGTSGTILVNPSYSTTYTITCQGTVAAGSETVSDSAIVYVSVRTPSVSLTPDSQTITKGSSANLTYSGSNISSGSCSISPNPGSVSGTSGTVSVTPSSSTTYTLTCTGDGTTNGGTASDTATVTVNVNTPTIDLRADGTRDSGYTNSPQPINPGDSISLRWTGSYIDSDSCEIGGTSVANPTSYLTVSPTSDAEYTITCDGNSTTNGGSVSDTISIAVDTLQATLDLKGEGPGDADYTDSPATINPSQSVSLRWTGTNIASDSCEINGGSVADPTGYKTVSPDSSAVYTIICDKTAAAGGGTISDSIIVPVQTLEASVSLSSNVSSILSGESATLTYVGNRVISGSCAISPTVGTVTGMSGTESVSPTTTTTYTVTCTGDETTDGDTVSDTASVIVYPLATVDIKADGSDGPISITLGDSTNVSWSSTYADSCVGTNITTLGSTSGSSSKSPTTSTTYSVTCTNTFDSSDTATDSVTVNVDTLPASVSLTPNSQTIVRGNSTSLSYSGSNIVSGSCSISPTVGSVSGTSGTQSVSPTSSTTYTITCQGTVAAGSGTVSDTATVTVTIPSATISLSASPTSVFSNESSTLTWSSTDTSNCSIDQGIGGVSTSDNTLVSPSSSTTYTLTCDADAGGTVSDSVTISVASNPSVDLKIDGQDNNKSITLTDSISITWSSSNVDSCTNNFSGTPTTGGSKTESPTSDTTYSISCDRTIGGVTKTATDEITVTVGLDSSTLDLKAQGPSDASPTNTPTTIDNGDLVTLSWTGSNISSGTCELNSSSVSDPSASTNVYPTTSTTYTLTCDKSASAGGGSISDSVTVQVYPSPTVDLKVNSSDGPITIDFEELAQITWNSTYSSSCTGTNFTTYGVTSGSSDKYPQTTVTYSVTCASEFNSETATDSVVVNVNAPTVAPSCGAADGLDLFTHPSDPDLCATGVSSDTADGSGTFDWECTQITFPSVSCSANELNDGGGDSQYFCGSDEDGFFMNTPVDPGLCTNGASPSAVGTLTSDGMEYWDWNCTLTDGFGSSNSSDCQAYKMPSCGVSINECNPAGAVSENETSGDDYFEWSCFYDYSGITDSDEHSSSPCTYNCPEGEVVVGNACQNVGNVSIDLLEPQEKIINKGESCIIDWEITSTDSGVGVICELTGYDSNTFNYSGNTIYNGSNTSTNVQNRASYTLECYVDGAPQILGDTYDVAETSCIINPDIDEF